MHKSAASMTPVTAAGTTSHAADKSQLWSPRGRSNSRHLSEQISDLKIELARRDADIQYLEGQLAHAAAVARPMHRSPHTIDEVPIFHTKPAEPCLRCVHCTQMLNPAHKVQDMCSKAHKSMIQCLL